MIFTTQKHAMYGFKVTYDSKEQKLSDKVDYKIELPGCKKTVVKRLNKCHEFINSDIQQWLVDNNYISWEKGNPPKFKATLMKDNVIKVEK